MALFWFYPWKSKIAIFDLKWAIFDPKMKSEISKMIFIWTATKNCASTYDLQYHPFLTTESNLKTLIPLFVEAPCIKFTKSKVNYEKINFIKCILFKCLLKFVRYPSYLWDVTWFGHTYSTSGDVWCHLEDIILAKIFSFVQIGEADMPQFTWPEILQK